MRLAPVLPLLFAALVVQAQSPLHPPSPSTPAKQAPPRPAPGRITGRVLLADTNTPARNATIFIQPVLNAAGDEPADLNSISHAAFDGTYTVFGVAPGDYVVLAIQPGYLSPLQALQNAGIIRGEDDSPAERLKRLAAFPKTTVESAKTTTVNLTLSRGAAISGTVTFDDGSPATSTLLRLEFVTPPDTEKAAEKLPGASMRVVGETIFASQSFTTDDRGHYRIASLQPGTYRIAALVYSGKPVAYTEGNFAMFNPVNPTILHAYAGNTFHPADASTFDLQAGTDVTGADISIPLVALHHVRGTLAAKDGRLINTAQLALTDAADPTISLVVGLSADGSFEFPTVPNGTYTLTVADPLIQSIPPDADKYTRPRVLATFAESTSTIIVKDTDLLDVNLTLKEIPTPATKPDKNRDDDEDDGKP